MKNNNLMFRAIEAVMKVNELPFMGNEVTFKLISCPEHYYGDGIFRLHVIRDTTVAHSIYEYLLKWNEKEGRFMTSSEF